MYSLESFRICCYKAEMGGRDVMVQWMSVRWMGGGGSIDVGERCGAGTGGVMMVKKCHYIWTLYARTCYEVCYMFLRC